MFPSIKRLVPQVANRPSDNSLFSYISRVGSEIASGTHATDLEGLVRIASSVQSFRYPAFDAAIDRTLLKGGDPEWIGKLIADAELCPAPKALRYLKSMLPLELPREVLLALVRKLSIRSNRDIEEFIQAVSAMDPHRISADVRNVFQYVVKDAAVRSNCRLGMYNSILELAKQVWESSRRHLLQARVRERLVASGWTTFLSLDMAREDDFVDAVRWLSHGEPAVGRKEDVDAMLARVEVRAKGYVNHEKLAPLIASILNNRKNVIPEPLDSISQLLVTKMNVSRLSVTDLICLVEALASFSVAENRPVQLDSVAAAILPKTIESVIKNINLIPSRALPAALRLIGASGIENVSIIEDCLRDRGHEMDGFQLVRLINMSSDFGLNISEELITKLFAVSLGEEAGYWSRLVSRLELKDKVEFLAVVATASNPSSSLLTTTLVQGIKEDLKESASSVPFFEAETVVRMFSAGNSAFESTGLVPTDILQRFLESENSASLSVFHSLKLLRSTKDASIAKALFAHVSRSGEILTVLDALELLNAADSTLNDPESIESALKLVVPRLEKGENDITNVLKLIPDRLRLSAQNAEYSPLKQLQQVALEQVAASSISDFRKAVECIDQLARLRYRSEIVTTSLMEAALAKTGAQVPLSPQEVLTTVKSLRGLRMYDSRFLDLLSDQFLASASGLEAETVANLATCLVDMGNKNGAVFRAAESVLKSNKDDQAITLKIQILNAMARAGVYSPLFHEELHAVAAQAASNVGLLTDEDWMKLFEVNLAISVESPPKIKAKYATDVWMKNFFEEHCSFSWFAKQERLRTQFIHSKAREDLLATASSLGWSLRVPEIGSEVYHVDLVSTGDEKLALITVPELDELSARGNIKVIVGSSMSKIKHLQLFGYKVIPIWLSEWNSLSCGSDDGALQARKECLLRNSTQVVYTLGASP